MCNRFLICALGLVPKYQRNGKELSPRKIIIYRAFTVFLIMNPYDVEYVQAVKWEVL
jgi:hypothetical protein